MRKIFFWLLAIVILIGGALGVYFGYYQADDSDTQVIESNTLKKVSEAGAVSPVNSFSNQSVWFGTESGRLMTYDFAAEVATEYPIPQILGESFKKIIWPRQGNDFIAISNVEGTDQYSYFNALDNRYYVLPSNVINLDWLENGRQIALTWLSTTGETLLVVSNPDASGYKVLNTLPWSDMVIRTSPKGNTALMYRANSGGPINKIYLFDLETGSYSEAVSTGKNTGVVWSPNGNGFAYSQLDGNQNKVYYHDFATGEDMDLGLSTSIDKVSFNQDGSKIYIAATRSDNSGEDIWERDFDSGLAQIVFSSNALRVKNIIAIGQKIFFLGNDRILYSYQR
jgi:hypothetical protein